MERIAEDKTSDQETTIGSEVGNSLKTGFRRKQKNYKKYGADVVWFCCFPGFNKCIAGFGTFLTLRNLSFSAQTLSVLALCLSFSTPSPDLVLCVIFSSYVFVRLCKLGMSQRGGLFNILRHRHSVEGSTALPFSIFIFHC